MTDNPLWPSQVLSIRQALKEAAQHFDASELYFGHGTDNAWDEAVALMLHVLRLPWYTEDVDIDQPLNADAQSRFFELCERRIQERIPAAYLTGMAVFAGLEFRVTPDVLIPRSPFGELIENEFLPWLPNPPKQILDLCTGCGCIGIGVATVFPEATVDLSDISRAALVVTEHNMLAHGLEDRAQVVLGDMFAGVEGREYDLILCNPPYVDAEDFAAMPPEYQAEPEIALASGPDGLDFCRRLLREVGDYLSPKGHLFVEVGNSWEALEAAYPKVPFTWIEFERGGHGLFVLTAEEIAQYRHLF